jgi:alpha-tubulin suppressor-like RCC1 family protein
VTSGNDHVCAIRGAGTVWCRGYNGWGGIGDGTTTTRTVPTTVLGISDATEIDASGRYHTCARRAGGDLLLGLRRQRPDGRRHLQQPQRPRPRRRLPLRPSAPLLR